MLNFENFRGNLFKNFLADEISKLTMPNSKFTTDLILLQKQVKQSGQKANQARLAGKKISDGCKP